jgi:hypothetical protein
MSNDKIFSGLLSIYKLNIILLFLAHRSINKKWSWGIQGADSLTAFQ